MINLLGILEALKEHGAITCSEECTDKAIAETEELKHDARYIKLQHDECGGIMEIDYQLYVRNYETFCPKCNKDLFVTVDFNTRTIKG